MSVAVSGEASTRRELKMFRDLGVTKQEHSGRSRSLKQAYATPVAVHMLNSCQAPACSQHKQLFPVITVFLEKY
jgi:hypothetical protein